MAELIVTSVTTWATMTLFVRGRQPESVVNPVTAALHELDPTLAVSSVRTMETALAESLARERISALISTSFGVVGLMLAALGLYGLLAYLVAERTKDIGIRIALGTRLARCSSASRRTTSRRTRSSSCCWAPSPDSRPSCPRAAPRASSR